MLLDTSGLLCCFDASDARHADAIAIYDSAARRFTHSYVLAEFVALAQARRLPRRESLKFVDAVASDADIELIWIAKAVHDDAMRLLQSQLDKSYSLCDAASFVLMQQRGIADALTTDRHFEQAGFSRMLRS